MEVSKSQQQILHILKTRGPQTVKVLAKQLDMTTMGIRQHLADLYSSEYIEQTEQERQTRGRPVHLWKLTKQGHQHFPDTHSQVTVELIASVRETFGEQGLVQLIANRASHTRATYDKEIERVGGELQQRLQTLSQLRSEEGYMAELRMLPNGEWLLVENHCPICAAAQSCQQFCSSELEMFQELFSNYASIHRVDHLLAGARRCAYKITPHSQTST